MRHGHGSDVVNAQETVYPMLSTTYADERLGRSPLSAVLMRQSRGAAGRTYRKSHRQRSDRGGREARAIMCAIADGPPDSPSSDIRETFGEALLKADGRLLHTR